MVESAATRTCIRDDRKCLQGAWVRRGAWVGAGRRVGAGGCVGAAGCVGAGRAPSDDPSATCACCWHARTSMPCRPGGPVVAAACCCWVCTLLLRALGLPALVP